MRDWGKLCSQTELWEAPLEECGVGVLLGSRMAEGRVCVTVSFDSKGTLRSRRLPSLRGGGCCPNAGRLGAVCRASVAQGRMGMDTLTPLRPGGGKETAWGPLCELWSVVHAVLLHGRPPCAVDVSSLVASPPQWKEPGLMGLRLRGPVGPRARLGSELTTRQLCWWREWVRQALVMPDICKHL